MCYDIKSNKWTYVAPMLTNRYSASCAVFKGKIVVTGGFLIPDRLNQGKYEPFLRLSSTESYCFHENKWTHFSDMLQGRSYHGSVSIENKLFVIGGDYENTCELLDNITNKFVFIKSLPKLKDNLCRFVSNIEVVSIGYKIYVYRENLETIKGSRRSDMFVYCYNKEQNALYQENDLNFECKVISCAKVSKQ